MESSIEKPMQKSQCLPLFSTGTSFFSLFGFEELVDAVGVHVVRTRVCKKVERGRSGYENREDRAWDRHWTDKYSPIPSK